MFNRALIINDGTNWIVAAEGFDALGAPRPAFSGHTAASKALADEIGTEDPTAAEIDESNNVDPGSKPLSPPSSRQHTPSRKRHAPATTASRPP